MSTKWTPEMLALKKKEEVQLNPELAGKTWNPQDFMGWSKAQEMNQDAQEPTFAVASEAKPMGEGVSPMVQDMVDSHMAKIQNQGFTNDQLEMKRKLLEQIMGK